MSHKNIEAIYPLSPMQQGILFHTLYEPGTGDYIIQLSCQCNGRLDVATFERAWRQVIARHAVLRTSFIWKREGEPLQVVHRKVEMEVEQQDWRGVDEGEQQQRLEQQLAEERRRGFELQQAPLMRVQLVQVAEQRYWFVWSFHHVLMDGWSVPRLLKEVFTLYEAYSRGAEVELAASRPYVEYIRWLRRQDMEQAEGYWRQRLAGFTDPTPLPLSHTNGSVRLSAGYASAHVQLSEEATQQLRFYSRQQQVTINTVAQAAWALLLSRYSGERDVVYGATVSGRPAELAGVEEMVGLFINTLPVRVKIRAEQEVGEWLRQLQSEQVEMRQYEYSPLVEVQGWSEVERGRGLFESIVVFENYPLESVFAERVEGQVEVAPQEDIEISGFRSIEWNNFPISLNIAPSQNLGLMASYDRRLCEATVIERVLCHLQRLLEQIITDATQPLWHLQMLSESERHQILSQWNQTQHEYPQDLCLHQLFEAQVERTPDSIALLFRDQHLTYLELNRRANQLAHHLRHLGVTLEVPVGLYMERSLEMVISLLAILKAGGYYVALERETPLDRLSFLIEDAGLLLLLTQAAHVDQLPASHAQMICVDEQWGELARQSAENLESGVRLENLAYISYTSGSTGRPKGVCIPQRAVRRLVESPNFVELTSTETFLQLAPLAFDASTFEVWGSLLNGGRLVVMPPEQPSLEELGAVIKEQEVTTLWLTAGLFHLMVDSQVKVRGYRIELGEVEAVLREHSGVREAVVVVREDVAGDKRLVAYLVAEEEGAVSLDELRVRIKERLPEYMMPSAIMWLDELPLTPNGKVDRRALPAPEHTRSESAEYVPPRTAAERTLTLIWSEVLRVDQVSIHDNFFELGGDSILSIQVISRANRAGLKLTPRQLFEQPSVAALAQVAGTAQEVEAEQGLVTGEVILTPVQHWFFEQEMVDPHHFNQAVMLAVPSDLDLSLFEQAIKQLLMHHDALRLRFHRRAEGGWQQINAEAEENQVFSRIDLSAQPQSEQIAAMERAATTAQGSLDLEGGPLLRVVYFDLGEEGMTGAKLLMVIHHLAVDGVSWRILLEDLRTAYEQLSRQEAVVLPAKTTSYQQWARHLVEYAESAELEQEIDYWTAERWQQVEPLPVDTVGAENTRQSMRTVSVTLDAEQTRALVQEVPQVYHTQINDLLLTALAQAFSRWSGNARLLIDLEGHGREDIFEGVDVSRTVGWFTSIFPVLLEAKEPEDGESPEAAAIKAVKEQMRGVPRRGIGYGLLKYLSRDVARGDRLKLQPQAEVSFNYLGQVGQAVEEEPSLGMVGEITGVSQSERGQRSYLLEINAIISGGELSVSWSFSSNLHRQQTIEALATDYINQLQQLIIHCQSSEAGGYTPSDFPDVELSQEELDELLTELQ